MRTDKEDLEYNDIVISKLKINEKYEKLVPKM